MEAGGRPRERCGAAAPSPSRRPRSRAGGLERGGAVAGRGRCHRPLQRPRRHAARRRRLRRRADGPGVLVHGTPAGGRHPRLARPVPERVVHGCGLGEHHRRGRHAGAHGPLRVRLVLSHEPRQLDVRDLREQRKGRRVHPRRRRRRARIGRLRTDPEGVGDDRRRSVPPHGVRARHRRGRTEAVRRRRTRELRCAERRRQRSARKPRRRG